MSRIPDPIAQGLQRGWKVYGGAHGYPPEAIDCDVAIVGSGAGAGISAELLTAAGLDVVLVEEGPLKSSRDFHQLESEAYPSLYQECAARKTADKGVTILQGRCVGGSTTVNWTSSFRTPQTTLRHWQTHFGLGGYTEGALSPWFSQAEARLGIEPWQVAPNANNDLLRRGAEALGLPVTSIPRNVRGCWNLGSCGMGCPTNAKQSMLVTTLPTTLDRGARLLVETRVERLVIAGGRVRSLVCVPVRPDGSLAAATRIDVQARHVVVAGGAIGSPALLLRSQAPDPQGLVGRRTFLHPVVTSAAVFAQPVNGFQGAPQTICTDHFLDVAPVDGPIGYKIESAPLHPLIVVSTVPGFGAAQAAVLKDFSRTQALIALLRDGFHPESGGGQVRLRGDGSPLLDYPLTPFVFDGARRALLSMAELQFAAGAERVLPLHEQAAAYRSWREARAGIATLEMRPLVTRVVSAHAMGGCGMAADEKSGVVRPDGIHWHVENLSVHDGSIFPTSIGANPQLSIYGIVNRLATGLAFRLTGHAVRLA
jgi:choline dehydrogenase-like flavoprotein